MRALFVVVGFMLLAGGFSSHYSSRLFLPGLLSNPAGAACAAYAIGVRERHT
jgi:hypothetical protein